MIILYSLIFLINIINFSFSDSILLMYPFFFRLPHAIVEDGWTAYRPESEFTKLTLGDEWRLAHINKNFDVSLDQFFVLFSI